MKFGAPGELPRIHDDEGGIMDMNSSLSAISINPSNTNSNSQAASSLSNSGERFGMHNVGSNPNMHGYAKYNNAGNNPGGGNNNNNNNNNDRSPYANVVGKGNVKMPSLVKQK